MQSDTHSTEIVLTPEAANRWKARLMPGMLLRVTLIVLLVGLGALADCRLNSDTPSPRSAITADR
jgi:hypothetical protein